MASTRKRSRISARSGDLVDHVVGALAPAVRPGDSVAVALSGGVDSVVLLDLLRRARKRLRFRLAAVHVNHQLSANAGRWATFCRRLCLQNAVPLEVVKVRVPPGAGIEAAARAARYEVLSSRRSDFVALGHHLDDQVETLLLQLLRGAGPRGLAAMPPLRAGVGKAQEKGGGERKTERTRLRAARARRPAPEARHDDPAMLRPLLDVPRAQIAAYARGRGLRWIDDESNSDVRHRRNFLRHEVLPGIERHFPAYRLTVARAARLLAECARLLDDLAAIDGAGGVSGDALAVEALRRLAPERARNLLRWFLAGQGIEMPSAARLEEALRQAVTAQGDAGVCIGLGKFALRRFEGWLHVVPQRPRPIPDFARSWRGERYVALPELGGVLEFANARGKGVRRSLLRAQPVTIRARRGGERLRPDPQRPRRTLKNLLQEARIPPWERDCLPLVYCGGELVWAAEVGSDCGCQARPGERSVALRWLPGRQAGTCRGG